MSAALAFTACTNENELAKPSEDVKGFYLRLSLEGEQQTRTQIKDEPQENASMEESKVTTGTLCKHSIASEAFCMNQVTFALQNIKIRLWQAVKILNGYWNFITRSPRQAVFR